MNTNKLTYFAILRKDFNSSAYDEIMERMEEDPEQYFDELTDECCEVTVIGHQYAHSPDQALEQLANEYGFSYSDWLVFLNMDDESSVILSAVETEDLCFDSY